MLYQDFSETGPERSAFRAGARAFGLHALGAVCAITLLVSGLVVTSRLFPHARIFDRVSNAFGLFSEDEPPAPSRAPTVAAEPAAPTPSVVVRRTRAKPLAPEPLRTRLFIPPPDKPVPLPQFSEEAPEIASVAYQPAYVAPPEFVLPPRPRNTVVRVLAALTYPFRFLGGIFSRGQDNGSDEDVDFEE